MSRLASPSEDLKTQYELPTGRPKPGLQFAERMAGFFHVGATDYRQGFDEGKARGSRMTLALTIQIDALDELLADPQHRASITGTVECTALSAHPLTVVSGEFRLLAIDRDRVGAREMVYTMALASVEGPHYELRGRKDVHNDSGFDLWADTTTLAVVVRGLEAEIGRGIVRIAPRDLVKMLSTLRVTNARGAGEKLRTQVAFGRFFLGSLYDVYGGVFAPAVVHDRSVPRRPLREPRCLSRRCTTSPPTTASSSSSPDIAGDPRGRSCSSPAWNIVADVRHRHHRRQPRRVPVRRAVRRVAVRLPRQPRRACRS